LAAIGITIGLFLLKGALAWGAEQFVYVLPLVGGLLQSLELVEITNVVVFALLGLGLGAATVWLPSRWSRLRRSLLLVIAVPIVFLSSYGVRQFFWVQAVAVTSEISVPEAQRVTDVLLEEATGHPGLAGFFLYTPRMPVLPTDLGGIQTVDEEDKWFRSELTRYSGVQPGLFSLLFRLTGWGIRLFYMGLAVITAGIYCTKGMVWADGRRQSSPSAVRRIV
jgi:succinate dehydrogenase/fumarate reductase cytochrome b subunit